jgi:hypothetical protein
MKLDRTKKGKTSLGQLEAARYTCYLSNKGQVNLI